MSRSASVSRKTNETAIDVQVDLDGRGEAQVSTGIPFFDHMLQTLAKHGAFDAQIRCKGDLHIDQHHTVEDTGIALGSAIDQALGDRKGIARAGCFYFPARRGAGAQRDRPLRPSFLHWNVAARPGTAQRHGPSVLEGFFKALADTARANVHIDLLTGRDFHHGAEAVFKSFARALRQAAALDPRLAGTVPSTKGVL